MGYRHTCAILNDDSLKCWGDNDYGQLGLGHTTSQDTPQSVNLGAGKTAKSVAAGGDHTCAILNDDSLKCWGSNHKGQLGLGHTSSKNTPQLVNLGAGKTAKSVAVGGGYTCAILNDDSLKCWGLNEIGQLGLGHVQLSVNTPQLVNLGAGKTAKSVATGGSYHTCAILNDDSLKCWGNNSNGQLGLGYTMSHTTYKTSPQLVNLGAGKTAKSVALGSDHTCAILNDDSLKCWGKNNFGQLGLGHTTHNKKTPQLVNLGAGKTAKSVAAYSRYTCAILNDDSLKCWGWNHKGQLGLGHTTDKNTPQLVNLD